MKLNFNDFKAVRWAPKDTAALIDYKNQFIRALVSPSMILFVGSDLDRFKGLNSNASNDRWRKWNHQESYKNKQLFKVKKQDFVDTTLYNVINTGETFLVESELAKDTMSSNSISGKKTAYKSFVNGPYQKAKLAQKQMLKNSSLNKK